jgi:hypothetical protein
VGFGRGFLVGSDPLRPDCNFFPSISRPVFVTRKHARSSRNLQVVCACREQVLFPRNIHTHSRTEFASSVGYCSGYHRGDTCSQSR